MLKMKFTVLNDEGDEMAVQLPARYEICSYCQGRGRSSAHLGAFTRDEMDEQGPEFLEDYMGGVYDRPCGNCEDGKVLVIDEARCVSEEQKRALAWVRDEQEQLAECLAIERAERAMGA